MADVKAKLDGLQNMQALHLHIEQCVGASSAEQKDWQLSYVMSS
jgi:hypothetical protein